MVVVTADGHTRHMMSLSSEQQAPANPVSTIPPTMVVSFESHRRENFNLT